MCSCVPTTLILNILLSVSVQRTATRAILYQGRTEQECDVHLVRLGLSCLSHRRDYLSNLCFINAKCLYIPLFVVIMSFLSSIKILGLGVRAIFTINARTDALLYKSIHSHFRLNDLISDSFLCKSCSNFKTLLRYNNFKPFFLLQIDNVFVEM